MKKILNVKNIGLLLTIVFISIIVFNVKNANAVLPGANTTWTGTSSITIRETQTHIAGTIAGTYEYDLYDENGDSTGISATITYTGSETLTNYSITKTAVMDLSGLNHFDKPGDYTYYLYGEPENYRIIVSVRNVVDANNIPTGSYTASLILEACTYDEQNDEDVCSKVSPSSGVLYADFNFEYSDYMVVGHIELSKTVKGIGADRGQYFPFSITIEDEDDYFDGWTYPISGIDSSVTYNGSTISNPTTITHGTSTTIYLKHGQTAIIGQATSGGETFDLIPVINNGSITPVGPIEPGIPPAQGYDLSKIPKAQYLFNNNLINPEVKRVLGGGESGGNSLMKPVVLSITETSGDYSATYDIDGEGQTSGNSFSDLTVLSGANSVDFVNTKEMSPVTGIIITILPYLILIGLSIGSTLLILHLKKEEKKVKAN